MKQRLKSGTAPLNEPAPAPGGNVCATELVQIHATLDQICKRHSVGRSYVYERVAAGDIESRKAGRRLLIVLESADRYFANQPARKIYPYNKRRREAISADTAEVA
jgi:hypothetical protein